MQRGIDAARAAGIPVEFRTIEGASLEIEHDGCCGQHRWGTTLEDQSTPYASYCQNCPRLPERPE
jgi:hypothetical protein